MGGTGIGVGARSGGGGGREGGDLGYGHVLCSVELGMIIM